MSTLERLRRSHQPLLASEALDLFSSENTLSPETCEEKLGLLRSLLARRADGTLFALTETRIEQSFNERLFAELFDYRTLLRDGKAEYHLEPKRYQGGRYPDFSLGFFSAEIAMPLATAELKSPGTPLDELQPGYGCSPVEQAFRAVVPGIEWVIVSDFDEIRLYRASNEGQHEKVVLSDITSHYDIRRAYALLGRPNLLGERGGRSPLANFLDGGPPVLLPSRPRRLRLTSEACGNPAGRDVSLHHMYDNLQEALSFAFKSPHWGEWPRVGADDMVRLENDRLVIESLDDEGLVTTRIDYTRNGHLRLQESWRGDGALETAQGPLVQMPIELIARRVALFPLFCVRAMKSVFGASANLYWSLLDASTANLIASPGWTDSPAQLFLRTAVPQCSAGERLWNLDGLPQATLRAQVTWTLRELLFPFEFRLLRGPLWRVKPSAETVDSVLLGLV